MQFEQMMQIEIQKLYDTEVQLMQGMEFMTGMAQDPQLKQAIEEHRRESEGQVQRLEQLCRQMGWDTGGQTSMIARALVEECQQTLGQAQPSAVTDAMLIAAQQKAEHVEIACYGTARTLAMRMGDGEAAALLEETLEEEKAADQRLSMIAESSINERAVTESGNASMM